MKIISLLLLSLLQVHALAAKPRSGIGELTQDALNGTAIATAAHCYGCTAGQGSSWGGALDGKRR